MPNDLAPICFDKSKKNGNFVRTDKIQLFIYKKTRLCENLIHHDPIY